jgi:hypothetical protein
MGIAALFYGVAQSMFLVQSYFNVLSLQLFSVSVAFSGLADLPNFFVYYSMIPKFRQQFPCLLCAAVAKR